MITDQSDNDYDEPISIVEPRRRRVRRQGILPRNTSNAAGMKVDLRDVEENPFYSLGIAAGAGARGGRLNGSSHRHRNAGI